MEEEEAIAQAAGGAEGAVVESRQQVKRRKLKDKVIKGKLKARELTRTTKRIVKAFGFFTWRVVEDVPLWSRRAKTLLASIAAPPQFDEADVGVVDIDVEDTRAPTEDEEVKALIDRRLVAEGWSLDTGERVGGEKGEDAEDLDSERLDQTAPVPPIDEVRQERMRRLGSASAELLFGQPRSAAWCTANHQPFLYVYTSAVQGNPHKRAIQRMAYQRTGRARAVPDLECAAPDLSDFPAEVPRVSPEEVIITVAVCNTLGHKEQEYDVLASQTLSDLRDALHFASDWMFDGPTRLKSACFFIDGVFYSDTRHADALDYSVEIIEWLKHTRPPDFLRAEMSRSMDVRLCDLDRIPFGERCVYIHQGDLEHAVYFTGMRLMHPNNDCPLAEAYPVLTFMRRYQKRRCYACLQNHAAWLVLDSSRVPYNPSFWCGVCFRHFFKDEQDEFVQPVDYRVFPYLHDEL